jgi:hypothetical protein
MRIYTYTALSLKTFAFSMGISENVDLSLFSLIPSDPVQQPSLCVGRCVTFSTKFFKPINDPSMNVVINSATNIMTVSSTSTLNENIMIPINIVAVLPNIGRLNCNFYYPFLNIKMVYFTNLIPPSTPFELRYDAFQAVAPSSLF